MLKIVRERNSLLRQITDVLKISANLDRLFSFGTIFIIMCHVTACMWYLVAKLDGFYPDTWVIRYGCQDASNYYVYIYIYILFTSSMLLASIIHLPPLLLLALGI